MKSQLKGLDTTVVGSFPLTNTQENMKRVFKDQIKIGIDFPCYPQLVSMTGQFLTPLSKLSPNLIKEGDKYFLEGEIEVPEEPFALDYGKFIMDLIKNKNPELSEKIKGTKACLTGPFTLASEITLRGEIAKNITPRFFREPKAIMIKRLVDVLAEIMKKIGKAYSDMGFNIVSMDEPILSLLIGRKAAFYDEDFYIEILNKALQEIGGITSIHVCGRISPNLRDLLLKTDVNILDHEFQTNKSNFDIFQKQHFSKSDKFLAMGTVASSFNKMEGASVDDYVESVSSLKDFIKKGIEMVGRENLIIKPDCGFLPLRDVFDQETAYKITLKKMQNMISAIQQFK
jgi:5-methyltetrahydropteroyltriglutamate--homocysteine methyltransferase